MASREPSSDASRTAQMLTPRTLHPAQTVSVRACGHGATVSSDLVISPEAIAARPLSSASPLAAYIIVRRVSTLPHPEPFDAGQRRRLLSEESWGGWLAHGLPLWTIYLPQHRCAASRLNVPTPWLGWRILPSRPSNGLRS